MAGERESYEYQCSVGYIKLKLKKFTLHNVDHRVERCIVQWKCII